MAKTLHTADQPAPGLPHHHKGHQMMLTIIAFMAVAIVAGTWIGIHLAEVSNRLDHDLTTYLLSIPADEWKAEK